MAALLVVLAFLLVGGSGFGYYLAKVQPAELNAQATSVVSNILTAQVQATTQAKSQALAAFTAKSPQDIYQQIINRKPDLSDPMSEQDGTTWVNFNESIQSCTFTGGAYHALSSKGFPLCLAENTNFSNLAYQARMTILHGDRGALLFRVDDLNYTFYRFNISRNGSYSLRVLHNNAPSDTVLSAGFNSVIATSEDRPDPSAVTVTIVAFDSFIYFYINGLFLTQVVDHTTSSGKIGVTAVQENNPTEVVFSNVKVWVL